MPCAACGRRRGGLNFSPESLLINQPQTTNWGPALWFILHTFAERVGRNPIVALRLDEVREFDMIIRSFPATLPCPACQHHAFEYIRAHPINWNKLTGPDITPVLRRWLYDFHNHVNRSKTPPTSEFSYEEVEPKYSIVTNIGHQYNVFMGELQAAITHRWVSHDAAQSMKRHLGVLRGFVGI